MTLKIILMVLWFISTFNFIYIMIWEACNDPKYYSESRIPPYGERMEDVLRLSTMAGILFGASLILIESAEFVLRVF